MKKYFYVFLVIGIVLSSCQSKKKKNPVVLSTEVPEAISKLQDSIAYSFAFVGCNRVGRHDKYVVKDADSSTANLSALKRIYNDVCSLSRKPDAFFFLGDLVVGETTNSDLDLQLKGWKKVYYDATKSPIASSGIEMIAIPGNHEMLYHDAASGNELPLNGATQTWLNNMGDFLPKDAKQAPGTDNQLTFSLKRKNVGFVLMNTDTYNAAEVESQLPVEWVEKELDSLKSDTQIEHIFVMGHKPYYLGQSPQTGHAGIADSASSLWSKMEGVEALAMLSAHAHTYVPSQIDDKVHQIVAGNGGSPLDSHDKTCPETFGYCIVNIKTDGSVSLISKGYAPGVPCYTPVPQNKMVEQSPIELNWTLN